MSDMNDYKNENKNDSKNERKIEEINNSVTWLSSGGNVDDADNIENGENGKGGKGSKRSWGGKNGKGRKGGRGDKSGGDGKSGGDSKGGKDGKSGMDGGDGNADVNGSPEQAAPNATKKKIANDGVGLKGCLSLILIIIGAGALVYFISTLAPSVTLPRFLWFTDGGSGIEWPFGSSGERNFAADSTRDGDSSRPTRTIIARSRNNGASNGSLGSSDEIDASDANGNSDANDTSSAADDADAVNGAPGVNGAFGVAGAVENADDADAVNAADTTNNVNATNAASAMNAANTTNATSTTNAPSAPSAPGETNAPGAPSTISDTILSEYMGLLSLHDRMMNAINEHMASDGETDNLRAICDSMQKQLSEAILRINHMGNVENDESRQFLNIMTAAVMSDQIAAASILKNIDADLANELDNPASDFNRNASDARAAYEALHDMLQ
ncbi:MAG: hypothetical protein FWH01_14220 [Oscillospiraceae bacterium]|nr:hypothetical protein [Oscillospiraceae bacterium]